MRNRMASLIAVILLVPSPGWAQPLDAFERLALMVNLGDRVQVQEQSGATYTGRLTRLTGRDIAIETPTGERRFTSDIVRVVAVRDHPLRRRCIDWRAELRCAWLSDDLRARRRIGLRGRGSSRGGTDWCRPRTGDRIARSNDETGLPRAGRVRVVDEFAGM